MEVLYRTYAHCIDGDDERWHKQWGTSLVSLEAGHVHWNLVVSPADLAGCSPVHSAYIPGLARSGGFWRHTAGSRSAGGRIVFAGQYGFSLVSDEAPPAGFEPALTAPESEANENLDLH